MLQTKGNLQKFKHILESINIKEDTKEGIKKGNKHTPKTPQKVKSTNPNISNPLISALYKQNKEVVLKKRGKIKEKKV